MKRFFTLFFLTIYFFNVAPTVFAESVLDSSALNVVNADSYIDEKSQGVTSDETQTGRIIISSGGSVTYKLSGVEEGFYKLLIYGKYVGSKPKIKVSGVGETAYQGVLISSNTDRRHTIGRYYLSNGENIVTLSFEDGGANIKELLFKKVEIDVEDGETVIEAHDYLSSNISVYDREDMQWNYKTTNSGVTVSGPVIVSSYETIKRSCTYKLNVKNSGLYRMTLWASGSGKSEYTLHSDGAQISKATFDPGKTMSVSTVASASFDTFNLQAGEQTITIKNSTEVSHLFTYYYVLERIGDMVAGGNISAENDNKIEAETLFYTDTGVEINNESMSIKSGVARADLSVSDSGLYAVTVKYKADENTDIWLRLGTDDEVATTLSKTDGEYVETIYQVKYLESQNIKMLLWSEKNILIDSIEFNYIDEEVSKKFVKDLNCANNKVDLERAFGELNEKTGTDYKNASKTVFYKAPLYEKILNSEFNDIQDFSLDFAYFLKTESIKKRVTVKKGTTNVLGVVSGNLKISVDTLFYNEIDAFVVGAIYEEENGKRKLYMIDTEKYEGQSTVIFDFNNVKADTNKTYSFDILSYDDFKKIVPKNMFPSVYTEIFVSENGSDTNGDGSEYSPFKTLDFAIDTANIYSEYQWGDIVINVDSGTYTLDETLTFNETSGGKNGFKIRIKGNSENPPVISGGAKVEEWTNEGNGIYSASLSDFDCVRNMYVNGYPAVRARSEKRYLVEGIYDDESTEWKKDGFIVSKENVPYSFERPEDLEVIWTYESKVEWESRRTPVTKMLENGDNRTFIIKPEIFNYSSERFKTGHLFYLENAKEFLNEPGEFYYSKAEGKIYYMPYVGEDLNNSDVYVGNLEKLIEIKGSSLNKKAENITFENLVFRYGAYDFASKYGYNGEQSDSFQTGFRGDDGTIGYNAQIYAENAKGIEIKNCEISCMGSSGIHFKEGVSDSVIEGNLFRDLSGGAITIGHPDHEDKQEGIAVCDGISIKNNVIRRIASEYFNNTAISVYYEKNIDIVHNDIDKVPYTGITAGWGWEGSNPYNCENINISHNRITNVMELLDDGGGIYTLGKLKGSKINNNYLNGHSGHIAGMVYQDSGSSFIEIFNNVILNAKACIYVNTSYVAHDLDYYNNYSNVKVSAKTNEEERIYVENPISVDGENLTDEALEIYNTSGVEEKYVYLLDADKFGKERKARIDFPPYTDPYLFEFDADEFDASLSSDGLQVIQEFDKKAVEISAGEHIAFKYNAKKAGTHKILLYGRYSSASKPAYSLNLAGTKGYGISAKTDQRNTLGRFEMSEGENEIILTVTSGSVILKNLYIKNVIHEISPDIQNLIEVHDYYTANISSIDQEDHQWNYEAAKCDFICRGPVIALSNQTRNLTYKVNVKEEGAYTMKIYYAGAPDVKYTVSADGEILAEKSAQGTGKGDPLECSEMVIENLNLKKGDITLGFKFAPQTQGIIYTYYFTLEK